MRIIIEGTEKECKEIVDRIFPNGKIEIKTKKPESAMKYERLILAVSNGMKITKAFSKIFGRKITGYDYKVMKRMLNAKKRNK